MWLRDQYFSTVATSRHSGGDQRHASIVRGSLKQPRYGRNAGRVDDDVRLTIKSPTNSSVRASLPPPTDTSWGCTSMNGLTPWHVAVTASALEIPPQVTGSTCRTALLTS